MAFATPTPQGAVGMQSNIRPSDILGSSTALSSEYLMHNIPVNQAAMATAIALQQNHPQALQRHLLRHNPYSTRPPTLPKRGVNSWMAFRSFYSRIFTRFQQKNTSAYIKQLWESDPFKAKWTIIARSYTGIRDHVGKANASLDIFLNIVCPQLGVIDVNNYFTMMNWVVESADDGPVHLHQSSKPNLAAFPQNILSSNMTEQDVIHFCASQGYISNSVAVAIAGPNANGPTANNGQTQQGLLATAAAMPIPAFLQQVAINPAAAATNALGFRVGDVLDGTHLGTYRWSSNMADLYHPEEGSYDIDSILGETTGGAWNTFSVQDSNALDAVLENGGLRDGYLAPNIHDTNDAGPTY